MNLHQKIVLARNQLGLTQEELATAANITVRTIQRIESGESTPRKYTLKLIATALNIPFEELNTQVEQVPATAVIPKYAATPGLHSIKTIDDDVNFLKLLCLSCFSYLLIPYIHFLIPVYLLKKRREENPVVLRFARKAIQNQIAWVIATTFIFLLVLGYNFVQAAYLNKQYPANYLFVFFLMYLVNALVILRSYLKVNNSLLKTGKKGF
jgi:transcriptional regulator with XRE-family HTH domain